MTFGAKFYREDGYLQLDADSEPAVLISNGWLNTKANYLGIIETGYIKETTNPAYKWTIHHAIYLPDDLFISGERAPIIFYSCPVPAAVIQVEDQADGTKKIGFITNEATQIKFWVFGTKRENPDKPDWGMIIYNEDGTIGWTSEQKSLRIEQSKLCQEGTTLTLTSGRKYAAQLSNASVFMRKGRNLTSTTRVDWLLIPSVTINDGVIQTVPVNWGSLQVPANSEYVYPKVLDWPNTTLTVIDVTDL